MGKNKILTLIFIFTALLFCGNALQAQNLAKADSLVQAKDYDKALKIYRSLLISSPDDPSLKNKISDAKKRKQQNEANYNTALQEGLKQLAAKNYPAAKSAFKTALAINPNSSYPLLKLDEIQRVYQDPEEEKAFVQAVEKADALMKAYQYDEALTYYQQALEIKPRNVDALKKTKQIRQFIAKQQEREADYDKAVENAKLLFDNKDYERAMLQYQEASLIKPEKVLPKTKIEELRIILQERKATQKKYSAQIDKADSLYMQRNFDQAKLAYQQALKIKPSESYPVNMISKIDPALAKMESLNKEYNNIIQQADLAFKVNDYSEAVNLYTQASDVQPSENYPKEKIQEIKTLLQGAEDQYNSTIAKADKLFEDNNIAEAKTTYQVALNIYPDKEYPQQQIALINNQLESQQKQLEQYDLLIAAADEKYNAQNWQQAETNYLSAMELYPDKAYPKNQIASIQEKLLATKNKQAAYDQHINQGDSLLNKESYNMASAQYNKALALYPDKDYPKQKLATIGKAIAALGQKNKVYQNLIAQSDELFGQKNYSDAIEKYQQALELFPDKVYPQEQIALAQDEIQALAMAAKNKQSAYDQHINQGDSLLNKESYDMASAQYNKALALYPDKDYPKQKLATIDKAIAALGQKNIDYQNLIAQSDELFGQKNYSDAIEKYQQALLLFPDKSYPQTQIVLAQTALADIEKREKEYNQWIASADSLLKQQKLNESKSAYKNAVALKDEAYPKAKIQEIDNLLDAARSNQERYERLVAAGDSLQAIQFYTDAITSFSQALEVYPDKSYPKEQIAGIKTIQEEIAANQKAYDDLIAKADADRDAAKLAEAKTSYQQALKIQADAAYPAEQIATIDAKLEAIAQKKMNYQRYIATADSALLAKNYPIALSHYNQALGLYGEETYPKEKIAAIKKTLADAELAEQQYNQSIGSADSLFAINELTSSKEKYQFALTIKQADYPQQQIAVIDQRLAEIAANKSKYKNFVEKADRYFDQKDYNDALANYRDAQKIFPADEHANNRISQINDTLSMIQKRDLAYEGFVKSGDSLYGLKNYQDAISAYQKSLQIYKDREHPTSQINKSMDILANLREQERMYRQMISAADSLFNLKEYAQAITSYTDALAVKKYDKYATEKIEESDRLIKKREADFNYAMAQGNTLYEQEKYKNALKNFETALVLKPENETTKQRINETKTILEQIRQQMLERYNAVITVADEHYRKKALSRATDKYAEAAEINPEEPYPTDMIKKIKDYLKEHSLREVVNQKVMVAGDTEKKFELQPLAYADRPNNFILITAKTTGKKAKIFLSYGLGEEKNGGIVIPTVPSDTPRQFILNISDHRRWKENENDWISVYVQGDDIEITNLGVSKGD